MRSKKSWKCSEGCNLEELGKPCPHLEKLLPQMRERNPTVVVDTITNDYNKVSFEDAQEYGIYVTDCTPSTLSEGSEYTLREAINGFSLSSSDKDIIVDLFAKSMTRRAIMKKYGITSSSSFMVYKRYLFSILRREGFNLKNKAGSSNE